MGSGPSRVDRRESQRDSARRRRLLGFGIAGALVLIAGVVIAAVALGGGGDDDVTATKPTRSTAGPGVTFTMEVGNITTDSAGPPTTFTAAQAQQVLGTIRTYVDTAVVRPLRSGEPAGDLTPVFDAGTLARATGVDRAVMLDEGLPKVTGDIVVAGNPVSFVGLGDQSGNLVLVTASVDFTVAGTIEGIKSPLHVERRGEFVLSRDASGAWKVMAYHMTVSRGGAGIDTTTSSTPATTGRGR
jgi:hypothetical protein